MIISVVLLLLSLVWCNRLHLTGKRHCFLLVFKIGFRLVCFQLFLSSFLSNIFLMHDGVFLKREFSGKWLIGLFLSCYLSGMMFDKGIVLSFGSSFRMMSNFMLNIDGFSLLGLIFLFNIFIYSFGIRRLYLYILMMFFDRSFAVFDKMGNIVEVIIA